MASPWGITDAGVKLRAYSVSQSGRSLGRILKNLSLLFTSLLVSALLAEAALRIAGFTPRVLEANRFFVDGADTTWSEPDPELGWINKEGVSTSIEAGNVPMTFWSDGRRATRPSPTQPSSYATSIMISGGSNAQSYGVTNADSFPFQLGQMYPNVWIENFGNGGYSTVQALLLAQRAFDQFYNHPPQLILLTFADSHVLRNVSDQSWLYSISDSQGRYVSPPHYRLQGDDLHFRPFQTIAPWVLETSSALVTVLHHTWLQTIAFDTAENGIEVTRRVLTKYAGFAKDQGSDFAVVVLEDYRDVSESVFAGAAFPVLNCSGFERTAPQDYLLGGGGHPNAKLHDHFTDCISGWLDGYLAQATSSAGP